MHDPNAESFEDPFLEEVQALKRAVAEEFGYDVRKLGAHLMQLQEQYKDRLVARSETEKKKAS